MIVQPVEDFKDRRRKLAPELQIRVDDILAKMIQVALDMCELPATTQNIVLNVDDTTNLRFILSGKIKILSVILE